MACRVSDLRLVSLQVTGVMHVYFDMTLTCQ